MAKTPEELKAEKALVAALAAAWVRPGMRLGIGSGSTVELFVEALGRCCAGERFDVHCVVASAATAKMATDAGLTVTGFEIGLPLDLVVDGADEIGPRLELTKGGGGAMLRERIVAAAGRRVLIIGDSSKPVQRLGHFPLPVEVFPFGADLARADLVALAANPTLRMQAGGGAPFVTDEGNWILDCALGAIPRPAMLALALAQVTAIAAHGLFVDVADVALIADGKELLLLQTGGRRTAVKQGDRSPFD